MALLDLKLRRDLLGLKSQALAVALVMACGLSMMIMTRSLILTLETTRDEYYRNDPQEYGERKSDAGKV